MTWSFTPFAFLLLLPGLATVAFVIYVWRRGRLAMAWPFLFLSISSALWTLIHVGEIVGADLFTKLFWAKAQYIGSVFVPVAWLTVGLQYTNRKKWLTRRNVMALSIIPVCALVLTWTNDWHGLIWKDTYIKDAGPFSVLGVTYGPAFWAGLAYSYLLLVVGTGCLLVMVVRSPRFYLGQRLALISSVMVPWLANVLYFQGWGPAFDLTPFAFSVSSVTTTYGILRFQLIDIIPIARDLVLENMADALFVLDMDSRVVDVNPAAKRLFDRPARAWMGMPIREVVEGLAELSPEIIEKDHAHAELELGTGARISLLAADISLLRDSEGGPIGRLMVCRDITEQKRAEAAIREAEAKYRALVEQSVLGVYIIQDDRYLYVNPQMAEMFGYTEEELLALPSVNRALSRADREAAAEQVERRLRGETDTSGYVFRTRHADGRRLQIEVHGGRAEVEGRPAVIGTILDVTEREETQDRLRHAERQYRDLFEEAPLMYVVTTKEGGRSVIEDCNNVFLASLGYARKEVVGHDISEFATLSSPKAGELWGEDATRYGVSDQEQQLLRKDGRVLETLMRAVLLYDANGRIRGERAMYIDISQRRTAEREIYSLQAQLYHSQKVEAIGRLAGGVAHDFNNMLTVVLGYSRMLLQQIDQGKPMYPDLKKIEAAAERAASLTQQLLAFSRQQVLNLVVIDLNRVVREIEQMLRQLMGDDVIMTTQLPAEQCRINADPTQLEQILVNLLLNARDAMPSGGRLTIGTAMVTLTRAHTEDGATVPPGRYVQLSVSDTGCGMTPNTRVRVFEPFFTTKEEGKGTGLGLATVYGTVKQLGGFIFVHSQLQGGTTFEIYLPQSDSLVGQPPAPEDRNGIEIGAGETVLLVEDDPLVREFSADVLTRHGYRVLEAESADRALTILDESSDPIHLLLTDMVMPGMNGSDLAAIIETRRPDTKILFMSAHTGDLSKHIMQRGGDLVKKPFSATTLLKRIRRSLDADSARDADATA